MDDTDDFKSHAYIEFDDKCNFFVGLEKEIISKLKESEVSFKQAEIFLKLLNQDIKGLKIK